MTKTNGIQVRRRGERITAVRIAAETPEQAATRLHAAVCVAYEDATLSRFSLFNSGFKPDGPGWFIARTHGS